LQRLVIEADATVDRQLKNFTIDGLGLPTIDLNDQIMDNTIIRLCGITGGYTGTLNAIECALFNLSGLCGVFYTVSASGTLTIAPTGSVLLWNVSAAVAGQPWTLDMNSGQASSASVQALTGHMIVGNMDDAGDILHIHAAQAVVTINASCTDGNILINGDVELEDNSGPGCTVTILSSSVRTKEIHLLHGLDKANPMTVTPTARNMGNISQVISGDGETSSTVTRQ